jgi:hypothetical protein
MSRIETMAASVLEAGGVEAIAVIDDCVAHRGSREPE